MPALTTRLPVHAAHHGEVLKGSTVDDFQPLVWPGELCGEADRVRHGGAGYDDERKRNKERKTTEMQHGSGPLSWDWRPESSETSSPAPAQSLQTFGRFPLHRYEKTGRFHPGFVSRINVLRPKPQSVIQPTISVSENQYLISWAAVSGASEP